MCGLHCLRNRTFQPRAQVIQITPRVSGPIVKLAVKDNRFVQAGELLFEIDPRTFEASLEQAQAQYDETGDNYLAEEKQVEAAEAQVEVWGRSSLTRMMSLGSGTGPKPMKVVMVSLLEYPPGIGIWAVPVLPATR